jgi:hypothetical protein
MNNIPYYTLASNQSNTLLAGFADRARIVSCDIALQSHCHKFLQADIPNINVLIICFKNDTTNKLLRND